MGRSGIRFILLLIEHSTILEASKTFDQRFLKPSQIAKRFGRALQLSRLTVTNSKNHSDWSLCIANKDLMPDPHSETGSQDYFTLDSAESTVPMHDVTALRFILRQPSPNWKTYKIEDISVIKGH